MFEALRPSEGPRVREHNNKCMEAKGEGPQDGLRETRAQHALAADAGRTRMQYRVLRRLREALCGLSAVLLHCFDNSSF